ncbi:MAG: hypothetical protein HYY01_00230 [Chloroflexi bacterium]|nr:hypothetical protein [Chloroflexota bacterium]
MPKVKLGDKEAQVSGWVADLKEAIHRVPEVESAYITAERDYVDVWIIIPERDTRVLEQIADVQWKLYEDFGSAEQMPFALDLHVIYRNGRPAQELVPQGAMPLPK